MKNKLQVLDFHAKWCEPCKMLTPIINQLIDEFKSDETINVEKIDVDEQSDIANKYNVRSVPTILFIKDEEILFKINGATSKKNILDKITELK